MNILIDIGHPAHVHLFKDLINNLKKSNNIVITVKDISEAKNLLIKYGFDFISIGRKKDSIIQKGFNQLGYDYKLLKLFRKFKIDLAVGGISIAHASKLSTTHSIIVDDDDDEVQPLMTRFGHPFADYILSPDVLKGKRKHKQTLYYPGYHELAYLHPDDFRPDPGVLNDVDLKEGDTYFILRFNAFKAHHDVGVEGLSLDKKRKIINLLKDKGKIFITTEKEIDPEFKKYQLKVSPEKIHSLLYYATMFIGDSQTMTSEAAVLGTPAVKINSFAGKLSVPNEIEEKYLLCFSYLPEDFNESFRKINDLLLMNDLEKEWKKRRQKMLKDKINVTAFMVWFVENYPKSIDVMNKNPKFLLNFK